MKTLTWKDFEKHRPCYDPQEKYGSWEGTMLDLMNHPEIPDVDKIWAFTRKGIVSDKTLCLFAVACAREVKHLMTNEKSVKALDVAEAFAHEKATEDELLAAWREAARAAREAAWLAAPKAASEAARAAARAAARSGAWLAGWAAARAAGWEADETAREAATAKQAQIAISLIQQHER